MMSMSAHRFVSKNKLAAGMGIGAIAMLAVAVPALSQEAPQKDEVFTLETAILVPGKPLVSFDISWFDPVLNRYFLADRSNNAIDVVDPSTNTVIHQFAPGFHGVDPAGNDFSGPDGVLTANNSKELWVGDSPGKAWVLDSTDGTVLTPPKVPANPILIKNPQTTPPSASKTRADELCYDPKDNLILIASPGEEPKPFVTFISTTSYTVVGQIVFDGKPNTGSPGQPPVFHGPNATAGLEQCGWSPATGKFYQNVPEVNGAAGAVAVIDPTTMKVETSFPVDIDKCAAPQGMAIGPSNQILLGCNAASPDGHRNTVIINANSGAVVAVLPDMGGADQVWFNEGDNHYIIPNCNTPCRTATTPQKGAEQLALVDSRGFRPDQKVVIADTTTTSTPGAMRRIHSAAADPKTHHVFVPIPAAGGAAPTWDPTICGSPPSKPNDTTGCIAVFGTTNDDRSRLVQERGADDHQQ
jgi:hypothetical protein